MMLEVVYAFRAIWDKDGRGAMDGHADEFCLVEPLASIEDSSLVENVGISRAIDRMTLGKFESKLAACWYFLVLRHVSSTIKHGQRANIVQFAPNPMRVYDR